MACLNKLVCVDLSGNPALPKQLRVLAFDGNVKILAGELNRWMQEQANGTEDSKAKRPLKVDEQKVRRVSKAGRKQRDRDALVVERPDRHRAALLRPRKRARPATRSNVDEDAAFD